MTPSPDRIRIQLTISNSVLASLVAGVATLAAQVWSWKQAVDDMLADGATHTQTHIALTMFAHQNGLEPPTIEQFQQVKTFGPVYKENQ